MEGWANVRDNRKAPERNVLPKDPGLREKLPVLTALLLPRHLPEVLILVLPTLDIAGETRL